ncbi:peptidoglycan DD-metalloendopeptidase family protein [bacterium]|nr:peptidoglycan DD-metalloendopeptidase family protein [bacterium]
MIVLNCRIKIIKAISILLIGILLNACSGASNTTTDGIWHTIKPGETLESISSTYDISKTTIQRQNDIFDSNDLSPGMKIYIPKPKHIKITSPKTAPQTIQKQPVVKAKFSWPSQGTISSGFGIRHGKMHEGLDITKDKGRSIRAAADGVVVFSGNKNGYGKTIIIDHGGGFQTLYAHNSKIYVQKNKRVKTGAIISQMGSSGQSSGIHLHFEVRYRGKPQNPLRYLPVR